MARNSLTFLRLDRENIYLTLKRSKYRGVYLYDKGEGHLLRNVYVDNNELDISPECMVTWK